MLYLTPEGTLHIFLPPTDAVVDNGALQTPPATEKRTYGKGALHWGGELSRESLYPSYEQTASILRDMGIKEDFTTTGSVRYGHRRSGGTDIYLVANRTGAPIQAECSFRVENGRPQLWDPVTGE